MSILTVTLNPALDLETETPLLEPGHKLRCSEPRRDPGGGGINVARAVTLLGGQATAILAAGGGAGDTIAARLEADGIPIARIPAPGETRSNLSVIESTTGRQFRFIFPGPTWSAADVASACTRLSALVVEGDHVVLSGSLPSGMTAADFVTLARTLKAVGARVVADTSGAALAAVSRAGLGLAVLRMDDTEAQDLTGRALTTRVETAEAATELVSQGAAEIVIIARGADGSVLATKTARYFAPAADVPVASVTGAGDSFVAGAVLAMSRAADWPEVLRHGCAAASAAVTSAATDLCDRDMMVSLLPLSEPSRI